MTTKYNREHVCYMCHLRGLDKCRHRKDTKDRPVLNFVKACILTIAMISVVLWIFAIILIII